MADTATATGIESFYGQLDRHLPAVDVTVAPGLHVRVFPVRAGDVLNATDAIAAAATDLMAELEKSDGVDRVPRMVRVAFKHLSKLVETSLIAWRGDVWTDAGSLAFAGPVSLAKLPASAASACVANWLKLSFSEEAMRPFVAAVEELLATATGQRIDIWRTCSGFWSRVASPEPTSSAATAAVGPIEAGPSPRSTAPSTPPTDSAPTTSTRSS